MNVIHYFQHITYSPDTLHRRFDLDLPQMQQKAKEVLLTALPFIGLYRPAGFVLSVGMNGLRMCSHLHNAFEAQNTSLSRCAVEVGKAGIAGISLVTVFAYSTMALCITTGYDTAQGIYSAAALLKNGRRKEAMEEAGQALTSGLYLCFIATGTLEFLFAFAAVHAVLSLYQARGDYEQHNYISMIGKIGFAGVRTAQGVHYLQQIQRRNELLKWQKTALLLMKILRGREASHLINHPLSSLQDRIDKGDVVLLDGEGNSYDCGAHLHGIGQSLVKGENLAFRTVIVDGKEMIELDFKVNHAFRGRMDRSLQQLKNLSIQEMREVLSLSGSHAQAISMTSAHFSEYSEQFGAVTKIDFAGLGTIFVGARPETPNLYDRVVVQLEARKNVYELHEILSFLDLDQALRLSSAEDIARLKIGHLFRTFCPREATPFERTEEFFSLSIEQLKEKIIQQAPVMSEIIDQYFDRMTEAEIVEGRVRYRIQGLAADAYARGARALTAAIMGTHDDETLFQRIASILRMGMFSTEMRAKYKLNQHGLGGGIDFDAGGADSVFTQLLTQAACEQQVPFDHFAYQSKVRIIISLDALELGTYQYPKDSCGNRLIRGWGWFWGRYAQRDGILEFIAKEQASPYFHASNEVMLKERLPASYIIALVVPDEKTKKDLLVYLREREIVIKDDFVRVGTHVTERLLA
jgi:hypothetical protein